MGKRVLSLIIIFMMIVLALGGSQGHNEYAAPPGYRLLGGPLATYTSIIDVFLEDSLIVELGINSTGSTLYAPMAVIVADPNVTVNGAYLGLESSLPLTVSSLGAIPPSGSLSYSPGNAVLTITGPQGHRVYAVWIPLTSVTPGLTYPSLILDLSLAPGVSLGSLYRVNVTLVYYLGTDTLDNPWVDEPVSVYSSIMNLSPSIVKIDKEEVKVSGGLGDWAEEDTVPAGSNYLYNYTLTLDIAQGYTLDQVNLTDIIPQAFTVTGHWYNVSSPHDSLSFTISPGPPASASLILTNATGVPGIDAIVMLTGYIDPAFLGCNASIDVDNTLEVTAYYTGNTTLVLTSQVSENLTAKHLTVEKAASLVVDDGAPGPTPGDTVEYTIYMEVADRSNLTMVIVNDTLGDGLLVDRVNPPELTLCIAGTCTTFQLDPAEYTYYPDHSGPNGSTTLIFNITKAVERITGYSNVSGGGLLGSASPTYLALRFNATIEDNFTAATPGNASVSAGDPLVNLVSVEAWETGCGMQVQDGSGATITVPRPAIYKSVVYVNTLPATAPIDVWVGYNVTYNLTVIVPSGDIDNLSIIDSLPPLYDAAQIASQHIGAAPPPAGTWMIGPNDNLTAVTGVTPVLSIDLASNSLVFDYGDISISGSQPLRVEILYTVTVEDIPFDDPLQLVNLATLPYSNTYSSFYSHASITLGVYARAPEVLASISIATGGSLSASTTADAWDPVKFVINITNTGGAPAYDLVLNNSINALDPSVWARNLTGLVVYLSNGTILTSGIDYILTISPNTSYPYWLNLTLLKPLDPGMSLLINYTVDVHERVVTGSGYENKVEVYRYAATPGGANYVDPASPPSSTAQVSVPPPLVQSKVVYWSQEDFTGKTVSGLPEPETVTIGEVVVYEINITVPEGLTRVLVLEDWLPALYNTSSGFWDIILVEYINESNITVNKPGVSASNATLTPGTWETIHGNRVYPNIVRYYLGDVLNSNNDASPEVITVRLKVVVLNRPENHAGVWPWNGAVVGYLDAGNTWRCPQCASPPYAQLIIHEPSLETSLEANTTLPGVNSTGLRLNLTLHNNNTSLYTGPAFDVWAVAPMPAGLTLDTATIQVYHRNSTGLHPVPYTSYSTPTLLNLSIHIPGGLLPGDSIHVYFNTTLSPSLPAGGNISITGYYTASSLPGTHGTGGATPGDPGTLLGERIYNTTASIALSMSGLSIEKKPSSWEATIGETVTYTLNITVNFGSARNVTITDTLDPGTSYQALGTCTIIGTGITVDNCPPIVTLSGSTVTFSLGNITKTTPGPGYIIINYTVTILDTPSNTAGTVVENNATLTYNNITTAASSNVTIVEPNVEIYMSISPAMINNTSPATVINITVTNTDAGNTSTAYDIAITDIVPPSLQVTGATHTATGASGVTITVTGNNVTLTAASLDVNGTITLLITATAWSGTPVNISITDTASLQASTLPGAVAGERTYTLHAAATVEYTAGFQLEKLVDDLIPDLHPAGSTVQLPPGGIAQYIVNVTVPLGTIPELNITDPLDPRLTIDPASIAVLPGPGVSIAGATILSASPLQVALANVSTSTTESYILVVYTVQASNTTSSGETIANTAQATTRDGSGGVYSRTSTAAISVVEPRLEVTMVFNPPMTTQYDVFSTMTITIRNTGQSPAYDISLLDAIPDTQLLVNATVDPAVGSLAVSGNNISYTLPALNPGDQVTIIAVVRAYAGTPWNSTTVNTVNVSYTSLPGAVPGEKRYSASDTASLYYDPILKGVKTMEPRSVTVGTVVKSVINITIPTGYATNITIIDEWSPGMTLEAGPIILDTPNITVVNPNITVNGNSVTIHMDKVSNNDTKPLNLTIVLYLRIAYIPDTPDGAPNLTYGNTATITWTDAAPTNWTIQAHALVEIPPLVGGTAQITTKTTPTTLPLAALTLAYIIYRKLKNKNPGTRLDVAS